MNYMREQALQTSWRRSVQVEETMCANLRRNCDFCNRGKASKPEWLD